jgi:hypothetical protein
VRPRANPNLPNMSHKRPYASNVPNEVCESPFPIFNPRSGGSSAKRFSALEVLILNNLAYIYELSFLERLVQLPLKNDKPQISFFMHKLSPVV